MNGQTGPLWVKLDRFLVNNAWAAHFPKIIQNGLPRLGSDHVPIHLEVGSYFSSPRPFRHEMVWASADGFQELVHKRWTDSTPEGYGAFIFSKKLAFLRD